MAEVKLTLSDIIVAITSVIMVILFLIAITWLYLTYNYADNATKVTLLLVYAYFLLPISIFVLGLFHFLKGYRV